MATKQQISIQQHMLWKQLEPYSTSLSFQRYSFIYTPGQPAQSLYLLVSGQVGLQMLSSSGRVLTLQVVEPGQMFGHSMLANSPSYDTYAEAIKTVHTLAIPRAGVLQALAEHPPLGIAFIEILGRYRLTVSRRLDEVAFKSVPARLASLLLDMADTYTGETQSRLPRRTHQQLADMINAYRETVTKVINQFRAARLLDMDRSGITLLNMARLRELAQG